MNPCIHKDDCGGCSFQGVPYELQLETKRATVETLLVPVLTEDLLPVTIEPAPTCYAYRNKMEYTFGDEEKGGPLTLGLHKRGRYMSVVTTDHCQIVDDDINLVMTDQDMFDRESYRDHLLRLPLSNNTIVGILISINNDPADAVNCQEMIVLFGRDHYFETILGLNFKVNAFSFFQTNVAAVETLYKEAVLLLGDIKDKTVYDLYSGTGTIAQILSANANHVTGVELVEDSVNAARENAMRNSLTNCTFLQGDVLEVLDELIDTPDRIVVDPPRAGIHPKALHKILNYGINQILYISCNPKTLAENLVIAREYGYETTYVKAYDNFPFTKHVETVVLMSRKDK
jgi:tRNA/tmRNA/rRNA uracil-C5-methylase (TrmA/RlmC/RlmD family)